MARWSEAACAGASSFGMSGTNAYAMVLTPEEPSAASPGSAPDSSIIVWERARWAATGLLGVDRSYYRISVLGETSGKMCVNLKTMCLCCRYWPAPISYQLLPLCSAVAPKTMQFRLAPSHQARSSALQMTTCTIRTF